jgi:histidyl-tRNA synthetase
LENKLSGVPSKALSKAELIQAPRGTKDLLPEEAAKWRSVERAIDDVAQLFGYGEIRTPAFEQMRLFKRAVGEETDIVAKEMFLLQSRNEEEDYALRPELTAPVVRAAIEHGMLTGQSDCVRLYYNRAANFRHEKPQKGRFRQFHQFGTELLGPSSPLADAETISFAIAIYKRLGLSNFRVRLNSLASPEARENWKKILVTYLRENLAKLSDESKRRTETNPMRVLDSKDERDSEVIHRAPLLTDYLSSDDREHFASLQELLRGSGIEFHLDPLLVRGLDYYSRTVFEMTSADLGAQDALCGGGRYDGLVSQLGGPATPAIGFGAGFERLMIALETPRMQQGTVPSGVTYVIGLDRTEANAFHLSPILRKAYETVHALRSAGLSAQMDLHGRSMKAQMREANKLGAKFTYIIGETELAEHAGMLKDMQSGEQKKISFTEIESAIRNF